MKVIIEGGDGAQVQQLLPWSLLPLRMALVRRRWKEMDSKKKTYVFLNIFWLC